LVEPLQDWVGFVKPLRFYPHFLFLLLLVLVLGLDRLLGRLVAWERDGAPAWIPDRLRSLGGSPLRRRALLLTASVGLPLLALGPRLVPLFEPVPGFSRLAEFRPDPFFLELAQQPGGGLIELPLGLGHSAAPQQLVHGRVRADAHADDFGSLLAGQPPRPGCLAPGLVLDLWGFGCERVGTAPRAASRAPAVRPASAAPAIFEAGAVQRAVDQGFDWLVVYPEAYRSLEMHSDGHLRCEIEALEPALVAVLGPPAHKDGQLWAWSLADSPPAAQ
jgi:hypothetical protein